MSQRIRLASEMFLLGCAAASACAQGAGPLAVMANGGVLHSLMAAPVVGEPYSAVQTTHTKRTLADGTSITHSGHHSVARDAEGRVRVERRFSNAADGKPEVVMVFVTDPVAHTLTTFVTGGPGAKVASVRQIPKTESRPDAPVMHQVVDSTRPQSIVTTEDLGSDIVQGQSVTVSKVTTVLPIGRAGNDAPITRTREVWTSPDLKLVMKEQWEDPRSGEKTVELDNFSRAIPDPALFRAPAGYEVKSAIESLREMEQKLEQSGQN